MPLLPILLAVHVTPAVALFPPSILLPLGLRHGRTRATPKPSLW